MNEHYTQNPEFCPEVLISISGRLYTRVYLKSRGRKTVYCFVRSSDGVILKAASWKAPAQNYSQGSIFDRFSIDKNSPKIYSIS